MYVTIFIQLDGEFAGTTYRKFKEAVSHNFDMCIDEDSIAIATLENHVAFTTDEFDIFEYRHFMELSKDFEIVDFRVYDSIYELESDRDCWKDEFK